jgi:hypothetical protein
MLMAAAVCSMVKPANARGNAAPRMAVAGRIWRANSLGIGGTVRNDSRHGISTAMVVVEYLTEVRVVGFRIQHGLSILT